MNLLKKSSKKIRVILISLLAILALGGLAWFLKPDYSRKIEIKTESGETKVVEKPRWSEVETAMDEWLEYAKECPSEKEWEEHSEKMRQKYPEVYVYDDREPLETSESEPFDLSLTDENYQNIKNSYIDPPTKEEIERYLKAVFGEIMLTSLSTKCLKKAFKVD